MKKAKIKIVPIPPTTPSRAARRTPSSPRLVLDWRRRPSMVPYGPYPTYKYGTLPTVPNAVEQQRPSPPCDAPAVRARTWGDRPTHPRLPAHSCPG